MVQISTKNAISHLNNPVAALDELLSGIKQRGLSYASKTLRFIDPAKYPALDDKIRKNAQSLLPKIYDGHLNSMLNGYQNFPVICQQIQNYVTAPTPRSNKWFIADIEMGLFQFVWNGGTLI